MVAFQPCIQKKPGELLLASVDARHGHGVDRDVRCGQRAVRPSPGADLAKGNTNTGLTEGHMG